ncbi:MAG TPA: hypothetical protein VHA09_00985 [Nitrososphaera sp.]|nr:hypothetical protein [Nitrososphaera sp.]
MSYRPKPVTDHYVEALMVNSENLGKQLAAESVQGQEIQMILQFISQIYLAETEKITRECEKDMMALERMPSPLRLFVDSIAQARSLTVSPAASELMSKYVSAWEDWM